MNYSTLIHNISIKHNYVALLVRQNMSLRECSYVFNNTSYIIDERLFTLTLQEMEMDMIFLNF
mgnify:CR=1 FL=1